MVIYKNMEDHIEVCDYETGKIVLTTKTLQEAINIQNKTNKYNRDMFKYTGELITMKGGVNCEV